MSVDVVIGFLLSDSNMFLLMKPREIELSENRIYHDGGDWSVITVTMGERIKQGWQMRGLTQRELADEVGVGVRTISNYERNRTAPGSKIIIRLAEALRVRMEFFFETGASY